MSFVFIGLLVSLFSDVPSAPHSGRLGKQMSRDGALPERSGLKVLTKDKPVSWSSKSSLSTIFASFPTDDYQRGELKEAGLLGKKMATLNSHTC